MSLKTTQTAYIAAGFDLGPAKADGKWGMRTEAAVLSALRGYEAYQRVGASEPAPEAAPNVPSNILVIPAAWMPDAPMIAIINHWTGGSYIASDTDKEHYNFLIEGDLDMIRGDHSVVDNVNISGKSSDDYAAHTLNANTKRIGVALCCMGGAIESPANDGKYPMTKGQWDVLVQVNAQLCRRYKIAVTPETVLSHAEVQNNLGIKQRGKWDFTRLSFDPSVRGARAIGDRFRREVSELLG